MILLREEFQGGASYLGKGVIFDEDELLDDVKALFTSDKHLYYNSLHHEY